MNGARCEGWNQDILARQLFLIGSASFEQTVEGW